MFCTGSVESVTPNRSAVAGISCIRPTAPAWLTTSVCPALSMPMTASTSAGETSVPMVAFKISVPKASAMFCMCCMRGALTISPPGPCDRVASARSKRPETSLTPGGTVSQNQA